MELANQEKSYLKISSEEMLTGRVVKTRPEILTTLKEKYYQNNFDNVHVELPQVEVEETSIEVPQVQIEETPIEEKYEVIYKDGELEGKINIANSRLLRTSNEFLNALKNINPETIVEKQEEIQTVVVEPVVEQVVEVKEEEKELSFDELMVDINSIVSDNIKYKKQIDSMAKEIDKTKTINVELKEETKLSKNEIEVLNKKVSELETENQSLERSLKALDEERIKAQAKYEEEIQAERLAKQNVEQFHEKKYREKEEKILKYLSAAISRGTGQEEKELPRQLS